MRFQTLIAANAHPYRVESLASIRPADPHKGEGVAGVEHHLQTTDAEASDPATPSAGICEVDVSLPLVGRGEGWG